MSDEQDIIFLSAKHTYTGAFLHLYMRPNLRGNIYLSLTLFSLPFFGSFQSISPYSGHYRPTEDSLGGFLTFLKENGVNISAVEVRDFFIFYLGSLCDLFYPALLCCDRRSAELVFLTACKAVDYLEPHMLLLPGIPAWVAQTYYIKMSSRSKPRGNPINYAWMIVILTSFNYRIIFPSDTCIFSQCTTNRTM